MQIVRSGVARCLIVVLGLASVIPAGAQPVYEQIHAFREISHPLSSRLAEGPDGTLYGAVGTRGGGFGAIFRFSREPDGTLSATSVHAFNGPSPGGDGQGPNSVLYASDGVLYGTTCGSTEPDQGTVFRLSPDGTSFDTLYVFTTGLDGCPNSLVEAVDGNLYGTTHNGGSIFRISKAGAFAIVTTLAGLRAPLVPAPDGNLYGVAAAQLFRMDLSGNVTTVHSFGTTGEIGNPGRLVRGTDGNFYGTGSPGFNLPMRVFRVTPAGVATVLATFTQPGLHGVVEQGADGVLYGAVRSDGSANHGFLFRMVPGNPPSTIHTFQDSIGTSPNELTRLSDGTLLGSTFDGGFSRRGVVFRIGTGETVTVVYSFSDPTPLHPAGPMTVGPDGALYGTTCGGGLFNAGTVFRLAPGESEPTVIWSFSYWNGQCPRGALAVGSDGALYGAAAIYGLGFGGTLFRVTTTGSNFSVLRFFSGPDGVLPHSGLIRASDGHFYGTTRGTSSVPATIFRVSSTGTFTTLRRGLDRGTFGYAAVAPLMQASDGNIYGSSGFTVFRMTLAGALTTFPVLGNQAMAPLAEGPDSALYAISHLYGVDGWTSSVFRVTPTGAQLPFATFSGLALGGLLLGTDGLFYGTSFGETNLPNPGSIFQLQPGGSLTTIHSFDFGEGSHSAATLTLAPDGAMYGSTQDGGTSTSFGGSLFRLVPSASLVPQRK